MQVSEKRGAPEAPPKGRGGRNNKHTPPSDLEQRLAVTEALMAKLKAENAELKKSQEQANSNEQNLQTRITELESIQARYSTENFRLEEENTQLKAQEQQGKTDLLALTQKISSLEANLISTTDAQSNLETQLKEAQAKISSQPEHLLEEITKLKVQMGVSAKKLEEQLPQIRSLIQETFQPDAAREHQCEDLVKSLTEEQKAGLKALESLSPKFQQDLKTHWEMLQQHNLVRLRHDQMSRDLTYAKNTLGIPTEMHLICFEVTDIYESLDKLLKTDFLTIDEQGLVNINASKRALTERFEAAQTKFKALRISEQTKALFDQLANSAAQSVEKISDEELAGYFFPHYSMQEVVSSSLLSRVISDKSRYLQMRTTLTKQWNDTVRGFSMIENAIFLLSANIDLSVPLQKMREELTTCKDHMRTKRLDMKKAPKEDDLINMVRTLRMEIPRFKTIREAKYKLKSDWDAQLTLRKVATTPKTLHDHITEEKELKKPDLALCLMDKSVDPDVEVQSERMHRAILRNYEHLKVKITNDWTMFEKAGCDAAEELMLLNQALLENGGFSRKFTMSVKTTAAPWSWGWISVPPFLDYWTNPDKELKDIEHQLTEVEKELKKDVK